MSYYSDPTANIAISSVDREMKKMQKEAEYIGRIYRAGQLSPSALMYCRKRFIGIYRPLLEKAIG